MVRKFMALFALVLAMGMTVMPVAAQSSDTEALSAIGVENVYIRMYIPDPAATAEVNPELFGVMVGVIEFDEAETAKDSFEEFTCGFVSGFVGIEATDCDGLVEGGMDVADVTGIGEQALEATGDATISGSAMPATILAVQHENNIFLVINLGIAEPESGDAIAKFLVEAEPVDTEVEFSEDGTSTGGFFDILPQEGDEVIDGLMPALDLNMMDDGATPAA